jgi:hypothetical protein
MTKIDFYFDPGCPWCWNASRWLKEVQKKEPIDITWKSFSLYIKNGNAMPKKHLGVMTSTYEMLRVIEAARKKHGNDIVDALYTEFGYPVHHKKDSSSRAIQDSLNKVCPKDAQELFESKSDESLDSAIKESMKSAFAIVGEDVGVPIIVFHNKNKKVGYFGPVLSVAPVGDEALKLWSGIKNLAEYEHFFELKRTRDEDASLPTKTGEESSANICSI